MIIDALDENSLPGGDGYIEVYDDIVYVIVNDFEYRFTLDVESDSLTAENFNPVPPYLDQTGTLVAPTLEETEGAVAEVDGWETGLPEDV